MAGSCKNSLGQKIRYFLARTPGQENFWLFLRQQLWASNYNDIFLAIVRNLHILLRNLYILARICTFCWELVHFGETKLALARKIFELFLANIHPGRFELNFFSPGSCLAKTFPSLMRLTDKRSGQRMVSYLTSNFYRDFFSPTGNLSTGFSDRPIIYGIGIGGFWQQPKKNPEFCDFRKCQCW